MNPALRDEIARAINNEIVKVEPVGGGDINDAYLLTIAEYGAVFAKTNEHAPAGMFAAEANGLAWLRDGTRLGSPPGERFKIPEVIASGDTWLVLEGLGLGGRPEPAAFGRALAGLHRSGAPSFGLDADNFLAMLPQDNKPEPDWPTFYVERRLRPLCTRAGLGLDAKLDRLRARTDVFGPVEPPARLHGDLWWGNVGSVGSDPSIFDPAVYGGHREIDLAMLALFGGLPDALIAAYDEVFPLADHWRERIALHQLYPLAAHACLFGGGYGAQVKRALGQYL